MPKALKDRVKEAMDQYNISMPELSRQTGIPSNRMYKWYQQGTNPKADDAEALEKWLINLQKDTNKASSATATIGGDPVPVLENHPAFMVITRLAEANARLADGQRELIETNHLMAEANLKIANSHEELVQMTKQSIANAAEQNQPVAVPNFGKLLAMLARVGTGRHWQTEEEGIAILHSEIYGGQVPVVSAGTQRSSDKKHSGKGS